MILQTFFDVSTTFCQFLFYFSSIVPMNIRDKSRGKPVELRGANFDKGGNRPHESYVETVIRCFLLFDCTPVYFKFWWVAFFILLVEIGDYIIDLTLFRLRNLDQFIITLGSAAINSSRSFFISGRYSDISIITCYSS